MLYQTKSGQTFQICQIQLRTQLYQLINYEGGQTQLRQW